ncbi:replication-relaxation family protein [Streptomyces sp. NPDC004589]|uniref:replication-relaxation family protein n=1 Tax=Streptomyces sp. NPDC004589 TaxID=3154553 RepID=UPI0033BE3E3E
MGGSKTYPYGSTSTVRGHVLAALGVLKVATADQVRRLACPGHQDNKAVRNACLDLAKHGLTLSEGSTRDGQKLWGLTPHGLDAAAEALARPASEMGGTARGAGRSGAPHAMAVNETVIAITRTPPEPTRPVRRSQAADPATVMPATAAVELRAGMGTVASWSTEVAHNLPSVGRNRSAVQTDAVLHAPDAGVPVLLVEVDNCTETADVLAAKFDRYLRFFRVRAKDHKGRDIPLWRTLYPPTGGEGHPPIVVVFNPGTRLGGVALKNRMNRVLDLTRTIWSGSYQPMGSYSQGDGDGDGYYDYADAIPLLFTTLERLQTHGPLDAVWWRCGHGQWQTLEAALANPNDIHAWHQRDDELRRQRDEQREKERQAAAASAWGRRPTPSPDAPEPASQGTREPHVANVPEPVPCEGCGLPITGQPGILYDNPLPDDGRHCPECRDDLAQQPPGLIQALFGRHLRSGADGS